MSQPKQPISPPPQTTPTAQSVTIPFSTLMADPAQIKKERQGGMLAGGLLGAAIVGGATYMLTHGKPNTTILTSTTALLGGVGGFMLGGSLKTGEEARSEILKTAAATPDQFGTHVKKQMSDRENTAFLMGALVGLPFVW